MSHIPSSNSISDNLYSIKAVRDLDRLAIENMNDSGILLMKRAGDAVLAELLEAFGRPALITVFCG